MRRLPMLLVPFLIAYGMFIPSAQAKPAESGISNGSQRLIEKLLATPTYRDVRAGFDPTVSQVRMTPLAFQARLLDNVLQFAELPLGPTGDPDVDSLALSLQKLLNRSDVKVQMESLLETLDNSSTMRTLIEMQPRLNIPTTFSDPFGTAAPDASGTVQVAPSVPALTALSLGLPDIRRIVAGVGTVILIVGGVVACGASVVCAVLAATGGTLLFIDNALAAVEDIMKAKDYDPKSGVALVERADCSPRSNSPNYAFCSFRAQAMNSGMTPTGVTQAFTLYRSDGSFFDVPQSNGIGFGPNQRLATPTLWTVNGYLACGNEPRMVDAVAVGWRVRYFWPNGTSSVDSSITPQPVKSCRL